MQVGGQPAELAGGEPTHLRAQPTQLAATLANTNHKPSRASSGGGATTRGDATSRAHALGPPGEARSFAQDEARSFAQDAAATAHENEHHNLCIARHKLSNLSITQLEHNAANKAGAKGRAGSRPCFTSPASSAPTPAPTPTPTAIGRGWKKVM